MNYTGISSTENDDHIKRQVKRMLRTGRQIPIIQTGLSQEQLDNFTNNIRRIVCCIQDDQDAQRRVGADHFEDRIAAILDRRRARYEREDTLKQDNILRQRLGEPTRPTPDFLLHTPIHVRGHDIHWIECKTYYGSTIPKLIHRLGFLRAGEKYRDAYGSGMIVFKHGFNRDLPTMEGVLYAGAS
tara:strand:+ start:1246 stop:1800 length:555 start_codon:yes stop_codon:yes gene_type:complete